MTETDPSGFASIVARLNAVFAADGAPKLSREQRGTVTALLERALDDIVEIVSPGMFVEVGSFDAAFSRRMKERYPDVPCVALEANPRVFERFRAEVQATGVDYVHMAAAAGSGTISFFIPETIAGHAKPHVSRMGSLNQIGAKNSTMTEVSVPAVALDDWLAPMSADRLCMWIDVEGAMDKVLDGAAGTLERTALIYCEIEEKPVWKDQALASEVLTRLEKVGFVVAARDFQTPVQFNALLMRADLAGADRVLARLSAYAEAAGDAVQSLVGEPR
jgi:FkbM family methyltransferase